MKQQGPCAFSNACVSPGPFVRLAGTNRSFCSQHLHLIESTAVRHEAAELTARVVVRRSRGVGQGSWPTYAGIMTER